MYPKPRPPSSCHLRGNRGPWTSLQPCLTTRALFRLPALLLPQIGSPRPFPMLAPSGSFPYPHSHLVPMLGLQSSSNSAALLTPTRNLWNLLPVYSGQGTLHPPSLGLQARTHGFLKLGILQTPPQISEPHQGPWDSQANPDLPRATLIRDTPIFPERPGVPPPIPNPLPVSYPHDLTWVPPSHPPSKSTDSSPMAWVHILTPPFPGWAGQFVSVSLSFPICKLGGRGHSTI